MKSIRAGGKLLLMMVLVTIITVAGGERFTACAAVYDEYNHASFGNVNLNTTYSQEMYEGANIDCTYIPQYAGEYTFHLGCFEDYQITVVDEYGNCEYGYLRDWEKNEYTLSCYLEAGKVYTFSVYKYYGETETVTFNITKAFLPKLECDGGVKALAKGASLKLNLMYAEGIKSILWTSSDKKIATVTSGGTVKAVAKGVATITVAGVDYAGERFTSRMKIKVNDPRLSTTKVYINLYGVDKSGDGTYYVWEGNQVAVKGLSKYSEMVCESSSKYLVVDEIYSYGETSVRTYRLSPKKKGSYKVTFTVDGKKFVCNVNVINMWFKRHSKTVADSMDGKWSQDESQLLLYKGEKATLKVKGYTKKPKFKSSNTKIATVNKNGEVTAKASGYATITATSGNASISYKVAVSKKEAVKAIRYAVRNYNSKYSQANRMKEGYYDCSSYVWRSYASAKMYIGGSNNWAPTAADLAKWCAGKKYVKLKGRIKYSKMLPGDLIFECGSDNGRYKGIYHVDLYIGNGVSLTVARSKYWWQGDMDVIVARPYK